MRSSQSLVLLCLGLAGCQASTNVSGLASRRERATKEGHYGEAVADYDAELARSRVPEEQKLPLLRQRNEARALWIRDELARAGAKRDVGLLEEAFGAQSTLAREAAASHYDPALVASARTELDKTVLLLWPRVETAAKDHRYVVAVSLAERLTEALGGDGESTRRLATLQNEARAFHRRRLDAATQPGEAFVELGLVRRFGGDDVRGTPADRMPVLEGFAWSLQSSGPPCSALDGVSLTSTAGSDPVTVDIQVSGCEQTDSSSTQLETKEYMRTETYTDYVSEQKCHEETYGTQTCRQDQFYNTTCDPAPTRNVCETVQTAVQRTRSVPDSEQVVVQYIDRGFSTSGTVGAQFEGQSFAQSWSYRDHAQDFGWQGNHTSKSISVPDISSFIGAAQRAVQSSLSAVESDIRSRRASKILAAAASESDPHKLIHAHVLAARIARSPSSESLKVIGATYALGNDEVVALLNGKLDASVEPRLAFAYTLGVPTADTTTLEATKADDAIADFADDSTLRVPLLVGVSDVVGPRTGTTGAVRLGLHFDGGGRDNGLYFNYRVPIEFGIDNHGDLALDTGLDVVAGWRIRGFGVGALAHGGLDGMGSKDSFVVPLAWNYGAGGRVSVRWLPWELEGSYVHLWRTENAPDYEVPDILNEDRFEARFIRYTSKPGWFGLGLRYEDYGGVGKTLGGVFYWAN